MRRPRIAFWIQLEGARIYPALGGFRTYWWCPNWLWLWAVRRVDRWHESLPPLDAVNAVFHENYPMPKHR